MYVEAFYEPAANLVWATIYDQNLEPEATMIAPDSTAEQADLMVEAFTAMGMDVFTFVKMAAAS